MNVKELIDVLNKFPKDIDVKISCNPKGNYCNFLEAIDEVNLIHFSDGETVAMISVYET